MKTLGGFFSLYWLRYPTALVYMLQSTEYQVPAYLAWFWRTTNFNGVMRRRTLDRTKAARLLLVAVRSGIVLQILFGFALLFLGVTNQQAGVIIFGLATLVSYPIIWAHLLIGPLLLGRLLISGPAEKRLIIESKRIFTEHQGAKIAVAGSYGKTTMKELLATVLAEGLDVAATPALLIIQRSIASRGFWVRP